MPGTKIIQQLGESETALVCIVHQDDIYTQRDTGILRYYHVSDGTQCELLNSLSVTATDIVEAMVEQVHFENTPLAKVCFVHSQQARAKMYKDIAAITALDDLIKALHTLLVWLDGRDDLQATVLPDLGKCFGSVVYSNLKLVADHMQSPINVARYSGRASATPVYKMPNLQDMQKQAALKKMATRARVQKQATDADVARRAQALIKRSGN